MFKKRIIKFNSYSNDEGWVIDVAENNTMAIYMPNGDKAEFQSLSFNRKKEVLPLIRFIEADINHKFEFISDEETI